MSLTQAARLTLPVALAANGRQEAKKPVSPNGCALAVSGTETENRIDKNNSPAIPNRKEKDCFLFIIYICIGTTIYLCIISQNPLSYQPKWRLATYDIRLEKMLRGPKWIFFSGCWELNPVYVLPKHAYYQYTTPR